MPATALNSKVLLLPLLLALCSFLQVAFGQANYVDPYSSMVSCPYFSTSKSNSATWDNPNTFRCPFDIDMCPGDTIVVSQCTSVTKFSGDGYLRLLTYGNTAVPQQWDKNDDGCGSAVGAQITFTFPNSGTSTLPSAIVNQCRNVTIMSGCFESKSCSGTTVFSFTKRMKRCGFGFYAKYTTTTSSVMDSKGKVTTTTTINVDCARVTAGCIQPSQQNINTLECPFTCPAGTKAVNGQFCEACPVGWISASSVNDCTRCPVGSEAVDGNTRCSICPAGFYNDMTAATGFKCVPVDAGCFSPNPGATTPCPQICPVGTYSEGGNAACKHCIAIVTPKYSGAAPIGYWTGQQVRSRTFNLPMTSYTSHCDCAPGYTGWVCTEPACPARIPGYSIGSIFVTADSNLVRYSRNYDTMSAYERDVAMNYFRRLLTVDVDINGDGVITRAEMLNAIRYRTVILDSSLESDASFNVWCASIGGTCYRDSIAVKTMIDDGIKNYIQSAKHRFDGSGVSTLTEIATTYPTPTMSERMCKDYNTIFQPENTQTLSSSAQWSFPTNYASDVVQPNANIPFPTPTAVAICGYDTGILQPQFNQTFSLDTTGLIRGSTLRTDMITLRSQVPRKAIYCVLFNGKEYECSAGLFYDGTPIDLQPELTENGVIFQYLDTSNSEIQFDIVVGNLASPMESKEFVVGINYISESCGRTSKPISFADKISMNMVGQVREYSVRAMQEINEQVVKTGYTTMPYRIPFFAKISGKVSTQTGVGVGNVLISYCHIDPVTGLNSIMPGYCPLIEFTTDKFGEYSGEIRVSRPDWVNVAEHFNVTASLTDRNNIVHTFTPPNKEITVNHLIASVTAFTDNTTIAVTGTVSFDPDLVGTGYTCPFENLAMKLTDDGGSETTMNSKIDGTFEFANTQGAGFTFNIPAFNGRIWRVVLTSKGVVWTQDVQYSISIDEGSMSVSVDKVFATGDIQIDVFDSSKQIVNVGMFGGLDKAYLDLGAGTTFELTAVDTRCGYKKTVNMASNFFEDWVPAMNYVVTLTASPTVPGKGTVNPSNARFFCDASKPPMTYFTQVGQLTQPLTIEVVNSTYVYRVEYIYLSGICFELLGTSAKQLSLFPATSKTDTQACYPAAVKYLVEKEQMKTTIRLFELYPTRSFDTTLMNKTYNVENVTVSILDQLIGSNVFIEYAYNATLFQPFSTSEFIPYALNYTIVGGNPFPVSPFAFEFTINVQRNGPDPALYQDGVSAVSNKWYIPVVGQLAKEVPNFYPLATDPTLIFMVLRDPPGGNSFVTWHAGTTIEFGMSMNSMQTFDGSSSFELSGGLGVEGKGEAGVAFGGYASTQTFEVTVGATGRTTDVGTISSSRASDSHYHYSMTFSYDISTSTDPNIAGHVSDVIVGGGVDMIVNEATEVYILSETTELRCFSSRDIFQWQPGHTTTFILPVIEIEDTMRSIASLYDRTTVASDKEKLAKQIENWATVLANYRSYNNNLTSIFTGDEALFTQLSNTYDDWNNDKMSTKDFLKAADSAMYPTKKFTVDVNKIIKSVIRVNPSKFGLKLKNPKGTYTDKFKDPAKLLIPLNQVEASLKSSAASFDSRFTQAFSSTTKSCKNVLPQYQNDAMKGVCSDFAPNKWTNLFKAINSACGMPLAPGDNKKSLANIPLLNKVCQERTAVKNPNDVPGGVVESGVDSIFGFLKDPKKFVTFGATAPITMSWTSTVTDSRAFTTELDTSRSRFSSGYNFDGEVSVAFLKLQAAFANDKEELHTIHIGKSSESAHAFERTVTVTLDDSDIGDYFAVRVTEDPVYATPIFTTMGGQSKCPGETMTSRRESRVQIMKIEHRCGTFGDQICDKNTLGEDGTAYFAAIIFNDSPTNEPVDYTIGLSDSFSEYGTSCGAPGKITGLEVTFDQTELGGIPYRKQIEVPFKVTRNSVYHCNNYVDVAVTITASCEQASSSTHVYQYGLTTAGDGTKIISYDADDVMNASESSSTFSVSWTMNQRPTRSPTSAPVRTRRLAEEDIVDEEVGTQAKRIDELTQKMDTMMSMMNQLMQQKQTQQ